MSQPDGSALQPDQPVRAIRTRSLVALFLGLYLGSLLLLAWRIGERPNFAYNWESYTVRGLLDFIERPTWDILLLNQGLMTDSGKSAVVVGPAWLGKEVFGQSWFGLRFPIVAIVALTTPLTWVMGRKLYSDVTGLTAALLVATSQVFLFYGRTATIVGLSMVPALIGFICLWMCVKEDQSRPTYWLALLQASLIVNSYFYSPIRFLWLIALVVFAIELLLRRDERTRFALNFAVTLGVVPLAIILLRPGPYVAPDVAVKSYFYGRGEQIFQINDDKAEYIPFLRPETEEERLELVNASDNELAYRLIRKNSIDLFNLLTDRDTRPAITDYWNPQGRLYPGVLVPLLLTGLVILGFRFFREPRARLLFALFWGFTLPLVLTSQIHIGRLIFIVPVLAIIVAVPIELFVSWIGRRIPTEARSSVLRWGGLAFGAVVVVIAAVPNLDDWGTPFPESRMVHVADRIEELIESSPSPTQQLVYVFGDEGGYEVEGLRIAELEMLLSGRVQFEDLLTGDVRGSGTNRLLYGAVVPRLGDPDATPGYCTNLYLVEPDLVDEFIQRTEAVAQAHCGRSLTFNELGH